MQPILNEKPVSSHGHSRQLGQGMTEYIIIVALIAIGAVTASSFFGARVQAQFISMGAELSGEAGNVTGGIAAPPANNMTLSTYGN